MAKVTIKIELDNAMLESVIGKKGEEKITKQFDATKLPNVSLVKLLKYGAQRFVNDGTGGADRTLDDKDKIANAKIEALLSGEITTRTGALFPAPATVIKQYIVAMYLGHGRKITQEQAWEVFQAKDDSEQSTIAENAKNWKAQQTDTEEDVKEVDVKL